MAIDAHHGELVLPRRPVVVPGDELLDNAVTAQHLPSPFVRSQTEEPWRLDLVEVAATARPPVVRIMDYGKYKFEMAKQARLAKKKQHVIELKEVKYRPGIDDHDFDTKTRHARRFLEEKNKVKVTMMFRGRQVAHPELGQAVLDRVSSELADVAKIESAGRLEGKSMTMILTPK